MGGRFRRLLVCLAAALGGCADDRFVQARGALEVEPELVSFGRVAIGTEEVRTLVLRNRGRTAVSILGVENGPGFSDAFRIPSLAEQSIRGGRSIELGIRFRPEEIGAYHGKLIVLTDDERKPRIEVSMAGYGDRPSVVCGAGLAFGKVPLNTEKTLALTCVNGGKVRAQLRSLGISGDDAHLFSLVDTKESWTLSPGEVVDIRVRFAALRLGTARAVFALHVDGMEDPKHEAELSGEGYATSLVAAPNCLHFGAVNVGQSARGRVIVANGGSRTVHFQGPSIVDASGVFAIASVRKGSGADVLEELAPQEQAEIEVVFSPKATGRYNGALLLRNDDPVASHLEVCLTGTGGGADIAAEPNPLDFGTVAVGMEVSRRVMVRNAGTLDGGPLRVHGASVSGDGFSVQWAGEISLEPGDPPVPVEVRFVATEEGQAMGTLLLESNDGDEPVLPVILVGNARILEPCEWEATPPSLFFASVPLGARAALVTTLWNRGDDECVFASPRFSAGTSSSFSLPDDTFTAISVPPGGGVSIAVEFEAARLGPASGSLLFDVSNPAAPVGEVPLRADVVDGCLSFEPPTVDFGVRRLACPPATRRVSLVNRCPGPVTVSGASFSAGHDTGEFGMSLPSLPFAIPRYGSVPVEVHYDPQGDGFDATLLELTTSFEPLSLPIQGRGTSENEKTDVFRQKDRMPVDILFVIDNSGSMTDKQLAVANGCQTFMSYALQQSIDFHIGVTTTGVVRSAGAWPDCPGGALGGEAGRLFPVDNQRPRWVTNAMPDAAAVFAANVQVGTCHWLEQGLEAAYRALTSPLVDSLDHPGTSMPNDGNLGFYRPEARLSVVIISDEDDQSDRPTSFYASFFQGLKGPGREEDVSVNVVVGKDCGLMAEEGTRYQEVAEATGGMIEPICTDDWGEALGRLAEQSFGYTLTFPLSEVPEGEVKVRVDGNSVTTGWSYDPLRNAVIFDEDHAPAPGAWIEVTYVPACQ
nr:MAG: hypothetical protein DIU72_03970 [Pseudomonadota bacterium]